MSTYNRCVVNTIILYFNRYLFLFLLLFSPSHGIKSNRGGGACSGEDSKKGSGVNELSLANVGGVFVGLLGGLGFSFIVALFEFFWRAMKSTNSSSSLCSEMAKEIKFAISCSSTTKEIRKDTKSRSACQSVSQCSYFDEQIDGSHQLHQLESCSSSRASGRVTQLSDHSKHQHQHQHHQSHQQSVVKKCKDVYMNRERSTSIVSGESFFTVPPPPPPPMVTRASIVRCKSIREEEIEEDDIQDDQSKSHNHLFYTQCSSSPVPVSQCHRSLSSHHLPVTQGTSRSNRGAPMRRQVSYDCTISSRPNRSAQSVKFTRTFSK